MSEQLGYTVGAQALRAVQVLFDCNAVIAGGFIRDFVLGRQTKDVDVWMHMPIVLDAAAQEGIIEDLRGHFGPVRVEGFAWLLPEEGSGLNWTKGILKFKLDGVGIDMIVYKAPISPGGCNVIEGFDFGICMIAYDGETVLPHKLFNEDVQNATLTFHASTRAVEDMYRVVHDHLPRLEAKFPTHLVKGLPENAELVYSLKSTSGLKRISNNGFGSGY